MTRVLLTNDDGYDAEGLVAVRSQLLRSGMGVTVIAPDDNRSGFARAVTCRQPVTVGRVGGTDEDPVYACSGSPVDCVRIGLFSGRFVASDVVVAGINHGVNMGDDATYSGTLGAAIEGALLGVRAIAFSQQDVGKTLSLISTEPHRFDLAWLVPHLVDALTGARSMPRVVVNVNFPNRVREHTIGLSRLGTITYEGRWMNAAEGSARSWTFWPYLDPQALHLAIDQDPDTDTGCLLSGRISLTPLSFDWSTPPPRRELERWAAPIIEAGDRALAHARHERR